MNNQGPFFNPLFNPNININYDKIINKLERLEKDLRILENEVGILLKKEKKETQKDDPQDMYMI